MVYLDHNATSPLRPEARAVMLRALDIAGNPSAIHASGREARVWIDNARDQVAALVNAGRSDIVFTSGGSEANALALFGALRGAIDASTPVTRLLVSAIEHDSVLKTAGALAEQMQVEFVTIPVNCDGVIDVQELERQLRAGRALVVVMLANNETGVIQPVADAASCVRHANALLLVDAVQACGKMAIDCAALGADYLTISAHKFGGPQGTGALVMGESAPFAPLIPGSQESGRRGGTENVIGIAGFGAASACAANDIGSTSGLRDHFETGLRERFPTAVIFGETTSRLPNTSSFAVPGVPAETAVIALDLDGVMVSSGAACSSGKVAPSHVLRAMGVPGELAACALRVSFGWNSSEADVEAALSALGKLARRIGERKAA